MAGRRYPDGHCQECGERLLVSRRCLNCEAREIGGVWRADGSGGSADPEDAVARVSEGI